MSFSAFCKSKLSFFPPLLSLLLYVECLKTIVPRWEPGKPLFLAGNLSNNCHIKLGMGCFPNLSLHNDLTTWRLCAHYVTFDAQLCLDQFVLLFCVEKELFTFGDVRISFSNNWCGHWKINPVLTSRFAKRVFECDLRYRPFTLISIFDLQYIVSVRSKRLLLRIITDLQAQNM